MKWNICVLTLMAFCTILLAGSMQTVQAQADTTLYRVETRDGNEFIGRIVSQDQTSIRLKTEKLGEIVIQKSEIRSIIALLPGRQKDGKYWLDNPQSTRYFWQPNGYGLKKGEAYYQNIWVFFNQVSVGVTDNFSVGVGVVPLFLFAGAPTPMWITPKFSIPVVEDKFNIGAGALVATIVGEETEAFGIAYGITTFGSRDKNFSIGAGWAYNGSDWASTPTMSFSAMIRTGDRGYFLTENYFIGTVDENILLLSAGGRRIVKRVGIDFALVVPAGAGGDLFAFPLLGITVPFGKLPGNMMYNSK